jgi:SAM-dependent methyltransferase
MSSGAHLGQWPLAARFWPHLGPPLRPAEEDLAFVRLALTDWCAANQARAPRALILGVTPEFYRLPWPPNSVVRAVDRTQEMIDYVWPGAASDVLLADWRRMDLPGHSVDIALCDGGWQLLEFPDGQPELCSRLARVIAPGGVLVVRLFVPPSVSETPDEVLDALLAGGIPNLNCLKLRLLMSLQDQPSAGIALHQVWLTLRKAAPSWPELAAKLGWSLEHLSAIDAYRDCHARYHCVTSEQVEHLLCEGTGGAFELDRVSIPSYAMGAQCPTLVFRRTYKHREAL